MPKPPRISDKPLADQLATSLDGKEIITGPPSPELVAAIETRKPLSQEQANLVDRLLERFTVMPDGQVIPIFFPSQARRLFVGRPAEELLSHELTVIIEKLDVEQVASSDYKGGFLAIHIADKLRRSLRKEKPDGESDFIVPGSQDDDFLAYKARMAAGGKHTPAEGGDDD